MIDNKDCLAKPEKSFSGVAITGLSYRNCIDKNGQGLNSLFVQVAKEALIDDSATDQNTFVVIGNCAQAKLISADQTFLIDGLAEQSLNAQITNPLQALVIAISHLQTSGVNRVLLLLCDSLENPQETRSSCYIAAFVLKPFSVTIDSRQKIYASLPLLLQTDLNDKLISLRAKYKEAEISPSSVNLFALVAKSENTINDQIVRLNNWFIEDNEVTDLTKKTGKSNIYKGEPWCSLQLRCGGTGNDSISGLTLLVETILSIQQRTFLPFQQIGSMAAIDLADSPFYINFAPRPWFHPQIHLHHRNASPPLNYSGSRRRAALHFIEPNGMVYHMVAEEFEDANELKQPNLQSDWTSELFTFFAEDRYSLVNYLQSIEKSLFRNTFITSLKDLAFTINSHTFSLINKTLSKASDAGTEGNSVNIKVAFVCANIEEFIAKIKGIINKCLENKSNQSGYGIYDDGLDIYWHDHWTANKEENKLAFVLPGLGAAYPNMLSELCLHFPEIRAIFDFVDYLSVSGGSKLRPSDRIFCRLDPRTKTYRETPASLAVMDSAVVTVLMAEWAIFTLLLNLDIVPDILLGSSTGEFAALTMSGAVDIFKAAPLFYHLSTGMVRALPLDQLVNLRSLRVNDSYEKIEEELSHYKNKVYLSANLSPLQLILTGDRESINALVKTFESRQISADFLPFAIPYHTSLVSDVVSADNPDIAALQVSTPLIESWSCSLAAPYPNKAEKIKKMTTDLFSKPILFRESIEALYKEGVRNFVEVGPRGNLAPVISETLQSRPHVSLAANRSDISAITQLQNVLAVLFANNIYMNLSYLFARRAPQLLFFDQMHFAPVSNVQVSDLANQHSARDHEVSFQNQETGYVPDITGIVQSFQKRLQELEQDVMAYLVPSIGSSNTNSFGENYLSSEIPLALFLGLSGNSGIITRRLLVKNLPANEEAFMSLAQSVLTSKELNIFQSFNRLGKRQEWLAGRITTKEAIRSLVKNLTGNTMANTDIEIDSLESGKPYIAKMSIANYAANKPVISITHKDGEVIAVAADSSNFSSIGIDLESNLADEDLEDLILNSEERNYIHQLSGAERALSIKKIWSAKESVAKLLGLALPECLTKLSVIEAQQDTGKYRVLLKTNDDSVSPGQYVAHVISLDSTVLSLALV